MSTSDSSSPSNVIDLAVRGVLNERAYSSRELLAAVRHIGGGRFQPSAEVVAGRIAALAEAGLLAPLPGRGGKRSAGVRSAPAKRTSSVCC